TSLFAEDGTQQLLLSRELGFALGGDLAYQDILRPDLGTHTDDAALIQVAQRFFTDIGDIERDLFRSEPGLANLHLILLDMDGGEKVLTDEALADHDGILEVTTIPTHDGYQDVLSQG